MTLDPTSAILHRFSKVATVDLDPPTPKVSIVESHPNTPWDRKEKQHLLSLTLLQ